MDSEYADEIALEQRVTTHTSRIDRAAQVIKELQQRIGAVEDRIEPTATITDAQATITARRTRPDITSELVSEMIAVKPPTAIANTRPALPCSGSVIVTTNVVRMRTRTSP